MLTICSQCLKRSITLANQSQSSIIFRHFQRSSRQQQQQRAKTNLFYYGVGGAIFSLGVAFAAVPLYRVFCQVTGYGGTTQVAKLDKIRDLIPNRKRTFQVQFLTEVNASLPWEFTPVQPEVYLHAGETALVFFTAKNLSDRPLTGVSTYNVIPYDAGPYFTKIQCFCFDEQMLGPHEEVDMPVFFYLDPEILNEPMMFRKNQLVLSYTFFPTNSEELAKYELPSYAKAMRDRVMAKSAGQQTDGTEVMVDSLKQ